MCVCVCQHMSVHARPECTVSLSECVKVKKTASEEERADCEAWCKVSRAHDVTHHVTSQMLSRNGLYCGDYKSIQNIQMS